MNPELLTPKAKVCVHQDKKKGGHALEQGIILTQIEIQSSRREQKTQKYVLKYLLKNNWTQKDFKVNVEKSSVIQKQLFSVLFYTLVNSDV